MDHGHRRNRVKSPTYCSWEHMIQRCRKGHKNYENVSFVKRWSYFGFFLEDMGERPEGTSLDRIDVTKGYCKENCRWADRYTQNMNRRNMSKTMVTYMGKEMELGEACKITCAKRSIVKKRLNRGWSIEDALNMAIKKNPRAKAVNGVEKSVDTTDSVQA